MANTSQPEKNYNMHTEKRRKTMGDPAQLNFISKLPVNTMKGVTRYKLLSLLYSKLMRELHQCHRERF